MSQSYSQTINRKRVFQPAIPTTCCICCESIRFAAIFPCNHAVSCSTCTIKLRLLSKDNRCIQCLVPGDRIIVAKSKNIYLYESYFNGTIPEHVKVYEDEKMGVYFADLEARSIILQLSNYYCKFCHSDGRLPFSSLSLLKDHLEKFHRKRFCPLCLEHRRVFLQEQYIYTAKQLILHNVEGDKNDVSMKGHPSCDFCDSLFYDDSLCYRHLRRTHQFCSMCEYLQHEYPQTVGERVYKDITCLNWHYKESHYTCFYPECLQHGTIAYVSFQNLVEHTKNTHQDHLSEWKFLNLQEKHLKNTVPPEGRMSSLFVPRTFS